MTCATAHTSGGIVVKHAWIREAPPNTKILAAYLEIENHTSKKRSIKAVTSKTFEKIEIHLSTNIDGVAKMKAIQNVDIPAEGKIVFAPGGLHLMLIGAKSSLREGDSANLVIQFEDGSRLNEKIVVKKARHKNSHNHDTLDHDSHKPHAH